MKIAGIMPIKNTIQALFRSIRTVNGDCRVFIATLPPTPQSPPVLGRRLATANDEMEEGVNILANQGLKKIHILPLYQHLIDTTGKIVSPVKQYFRSFTRMGCMVACEVMMWEAGMKKYWFEDRLTPCS